MNIKVEFYPHNIIPWVITEDGRIFYLDVIQSGPELKETYKWVELPRLPLEDADSKTEKGS